MSEEDDHKTACLPTRKFAGMEFDSETGNYYDYARFYSPRLGRFMSPDPADLTAVDPTNPQSWNRYTYVLNNPTSFTDPSGLLIGTGAGDDTLDQLLFLLENGGSWGDNFGQVVGGGVAPQTQNAQSQPTVITWPHLQKLVAQNNRSSFCDNLIDCIVFKESSVPGGFNANAVPLNSEGQPMPGATARGLMQVTVGAANYVARGNASSPAGNSLYGQMFNPATNIQAGSAYIALLTHLRGTLGEALVGYGGSDSYAQDILNCVSKLFAGDVAGAEAAAHGAQ